MSGDRLALLLVQLVLCLAGFALGWWLVDHLTLGWH